MLLFCLRVPKIRLTLDSIGAFEKEIRMDDSARRVARERYAEGLSLKRICRETGLTRHQLIYATESVPRRRPRLSRQMIAAIQSDEQTSVRELASRLGVCKSSVHYWRHRLWENQDSADDEDMIEITPLERAVHCPVHGLVRTSPCVRCLAESAQRQKYE